MQPLLNTLRQGSGCRGLGGERAALLASALLELDCTGAACAELELASASRPPLAVHPEQNDLRPTHCTPHPSEAHLAGAALAGRRASRLAQARRHGACRCARLGARQGVALTGEGVMESWWAGRQGLVGGRHGGHTRPPPSTLCRTPAVPSHCLPPCATHAPAMSSERPERCQRGGPGPWERPRPRRRQRATTAPPVAPAGASPALI